MAFKTFAPGVLTSSDVNTFLMQQAVITCTSSTRPSSPVEGMTIYETDTDELRIYSGSAWESGLYVGAWDAYTPTLQSSGTGTDWVLGNGTIEGRFAKIGRTVVGRIEIVFGSTTTFGTKRLGCSAPVNAQDTGNEVPRGALWLLDDSLSNPYIGTMSYNGNNFDFLAHSVSATYALYEDVTNSVPFTWASGDSIRGHFMYEAAA